MQTEDKELERQRKRMTYQLVLSGRDGMVIASDQKEILAPRSNEEGEGYKPNLVTKIRIDPSRKFAWAFAGKTLSATTSGYIERTLESMPTNLEADIDKILRDSCDRAWKENATGPDNESTVILADGPRKRILRARISPMTVIEPIMGGKCFGGQAFNAASFIPRRFYSPQMTVAELACMAAYTLREAHEADTVCVDGLDIAIYKDETARFDFVLDSDAFWRHAETIHSEILNLLRARAIPLSSTQL